MGDCYRERTWIGHMTHAIGHGINKLLKEKRKKGIEESDWYQRQVKKEQEKNKDKPQRKIPWSKEEDQKRIEYHLQKFNDEMEKIMERGPP